MSLRAETDALRRRLQRWSSEPDTELQARYFFRYLPHDGLGLYRRLRMATGSLLRSLGLRRARPLEPWVPRLQHTACSEEARPFVIWALETDRDTLRAACRGFAARHATMPGWVPVLITDVADFAFFSRLGWLVEYVPALAAPAGSYAERKQRYLAWRYRDAPVVPVAAGLTQDPPLEELLLD